MFEIMVTFSNWPQAFCIYEPNAECIFSILLLCSIDVNKIDAWCIVLRFLEDQNQESPD